MTCKFGSAVLNKIGIISFVVSAILAVASSVVLLSGLTIVASPYDYENLPNFAPSQCTTSAVTVVLMKRCEVFRGEFDDAYFDEWVAVWRCRETGASIIENPFAANRRKTVAVNNMNDYPLEVLQNVTCNTINLPAEYPSVTNFFQCQVWNTCFFDVDMIEDLQENAAKRYERGHNLLYASAGLFVASCIFFVIFMLDICGPCSKKTEFV